MDLRNDILSYLLENYYQPNLSSDMARRLDMNEDALINQIDLINREKNGLIVLREGMGKNKYVISLMPNSDEEIKNFLASGGYDHLNTSQTEDANDKKMRHDLSNSHPIKEKRSGKGSWISIFALIFSLAALALAIYNHLLFGGYL